MNIKSLFAIVISASFIVAFVACNDGSNETSVHTIHDAGAWHTVSTKTCNVDGVKELRCTVCQFVLNTDIEPAEGHKWVAGENVDLEPTCEDEGYGDTVCSICDEQGETGTIPALDHNMIDDGEQTPATCIETGIMNTKCDREGCTHTSTRIIDIEPNAHDMGEWIPTTPATYIAEGIETNTCKNTDCNHTSGTQSSPQKIITSTEEFITAIGTLNNNNASSPYNLKLDIDGVGGSFDAVGSIGHTLTANSGKYVSLEFTGNSLVSIDQHAFNNCSNIVSVAIPSSVTTIWNWAFNGCSNLYSVTFKSGSNITTFGIAVFPEYTTGEGGNRLRTAYEALSKPLTTDITFGRSANGLFWNICNQHNFIWEETTAPTCTTAAIESEKCSDCSTRGTATRTGRDALGHDMVWTVTKPVTETSTGLRDGVCQRSGCMYTEQQIIQLPVAGLYTNDPFLAGELITEVAANDIAAVFTYIGTSGNEGTYTLLINQNVNMTGLRPIGINRHLTIIGLGSECKITMASDARFTVNATNSRFTLGNNITLDGGDINRTNSLVTIIMDSAVFTMKDGSKIIGNRTSSVNSTVNIANGTFIMEGGTITGNISTSTDEGATGGVLIGYSNSTYLGNFEMKGGTITGNFRDTNIADDVYVVTGGIFTQTGGTIGVKRP